MTRILIDTHAFFWWLLDEAALPSTVLSVLEDSGNQVVVSAVVPWELATKGRVGKWPEAASALAALDLLVANGRVEALPISLAHARLAGELNHAHRDPFDRMLAAQSIIEGLPLVSGDRVFRDWNLNLLWQAPR